MNKNKPTASRVIWTTKALNYFLEMHGDIDNMRIQKTERSERFADGTLRDANKLCKFITNNLGITSVKINRKKAFTPTFWYANNDDVDIQGILSCQKVFFLQLICIDKSTVSNKLEEAYSRVTEKYIKHQRNWNSADSVEIINFTEDNELNDDDMDALFGYDVEENRSNIEDDVFMGYI